MNIENNIFLKKESSKIRKLPRLKGLLIVVFCLLFSGNNIAQVSNISQDSTYYPFAVWYSGGKARATMLSEINAKSKTEWRADLKRIKDLGFNTVKTWVEWAHCEPKENEFDFDNLNLLFQLSEEVGLKVFIQVYAESAPDWVGEKFPNSEFEAQNGYKIISQVNPGYCVDNKPIKDAMSRFYEEAAKVATKYSNFVGWDVWSEPHIVQWGRPDWISNASYCYCEGTQKRFRDWLKNKYGTLENLNKAWYRNIVNWNDVEAPRFTTILSYTDFIDWREFNAQKMAGDLKMRYDAIRTVDKDHIVSSHASPVSLFSTPYGSAENDFLMSKQVDFYGLSQYPKHNLPGDWKPWLFMTGADFSYSSNKENGGYYVGEFQAGIGTVGLNVGDPVTSEDQRIWLWSSIASGAKGVFVYAYYPMSSGYESGGYGLVNLDGSVTERAVSLGKIANTVNENGNVFTQYKPVNAEVALLYNPLSQLIGGQRRTQQNGHTNSLVGYYRFFKDHNIPVEFIYLDDLSKKDLSKYKLIVMPYSLMFKQAAATKLQNYVENGGNILGEARLAWNDSRGFASEVIPGMGFSELFGIREHSIKSSPKAPVLMTTSDISLSNDNVIWTKDTLVGTYFAESLDITNEKSTKAIAYLEDGTIGATVSSYGKGKAVFFGSFLALDYTQGSLWDQSTNEFIVKDSVFEGNNRFLLNVLKMTKIKKPIVTDLPYLPDNPIVLRLHESPDKMNYALYLLNQGNEQQRSFSVDVRVNHEGTYELKELISGMVMTKKSIDNMISFKSTGISAKDARVWLIKLKN